MVKPDVLLKKISLIDGKNSSMEDMSTRQKIATFPSELYNANITETVTGEYELTVLLYHSVDVCLVVG